MKSITPYLNFDGNCREAMTFYKDCLGAELRMVPFSEVPGGGGPQVPPEAQDRLMHAHLSQGSMVIMASDILPGMEFHQGNNFSITIDCESVEEIEKLFAALSRGANVGMPLQETFWAKRFAMITDKFGVRWMFNLDK